MGTVFSRGERPSEIHHQLVAACDDDDLSMNGSMNGYGGAHGRSSDAYGLTVNVTMPVYAAADADADAEADPDADAEAGGSPPRAAGEERPGQLMQRFALPDPGSYLKMEFNQLTLYVDADGRMELYNEGRPAVSVKARGSVEV
tara:strand:+ start:474 stop:905 length:432 start_codon:yes stop_codon:yes gene_type:complete